jgi:branched-chain amino acid aminotransferase
MEWPSFAHIPLEEALPMSRPTGQALSRFVWWDGEIREAKDQSVHYYANALHYGTAVFEGVRVYPTSRGPALFRVNDHMLRLLGSARLYGMNIPYGVDELVQGALQVTRDNGLSDQQLQPLQPHHHRDRHDVPGTAPEERGIVTPAVSGVCRLRGEDALATRAVRLVR